MRNPLPKNDGIDFNVMVSFRGAEANSEKSGEFSNTPYHRDNCRISGKNTGKLKDIKNGANIVHPIPVF